MATRPAWAQNDTACADLFQTGADDPSQLGALQADCFRGLLTQSAAVQAETAARFIRQDLPYVPLDLEDADFAALAPAAERLLRAHYSRQQTRLDIAGLSERLNRQIAAAEAVGDELSLVYLHRSAGAEAFKRTDTEAMKRHFSEGLRLARKNGLRHMVPELVHSLALTAKLGGDYSRAIDLYRESLTLLEERNEFAKVGVIYASIAVLFSEIGDHDTAIDLNMKAMDYYRDYMDENPRQMATAMMNSGTAHHRAGRHEQAIEAYEKAAEYQKAVASDWLNGILNFNWARALYKLGNREAAIARGETALGQIAELRDPDEAAVAMSWLAERYIEDGRMDDAEKLLDEAQSIMEPPGSQRLTERDGDGSKLRQLQYSRATAHVLMGLGRTGEAQRYTEAAFMLGDQRYEAEKVRALANAKLVVELRDRENDLAIARQQELLADSELSQAQLRIALLIAAAALASLFAVFLWRSSRAQRAHIATKDMLLSEIHHRTKNNLQVLISLLNLDARRRGREEGASATSRDAANRARAMALVHDHIYQKTDSIDIDGRQFLADLLELLQRSLGHPGIRVTSHLCDVKIDADTATPLGLLVSEVITNAYKYAFPDGRAGELRVVFEPGNGGLTLRITDDGVGFDVNSSPRRSGSLGFDLIADLTAKLGARHEVMSGNGGTTWVFSRIEPRLGRKSEDRSLVSVSH